MKRVRLGIFQIRETGAVIYRVIDENQCVWDLSCDKFEPLGVTAPFILSQKPDQPGDLVAP